VNGVSVQLGTLAGAGSLANSHATNTATINVGAGAFSGSISDGTVLGGMVLNKIGAGTLALTGSNFHTGATNVNGGTLLATPGSLNGTTVTVANGATFASPVAVSGSLNTTSINVSAGGILACSCRPPETR
jgi:autotransporter-associated beta strand protein